MYDYRAVARTGGGCWETSKTRRYILDKKQTLMSCNTYQVSGHVYPVVRWGGFVARTWGRTKDVEKGKVNSCSTSRLLSVV